MDKKYLFVIGLHRSGTTLLSEMLGASPNVSSFKSTGVKMNEGQFLQTVYPTGSVTGGPGKFAFNSESRLDENSKLVTDLNRQSLMESWAKYWDLSKDILLEKSPPNMLKTRFLQSMFPNSYFLLLMRDPIPVSYATKKWSRTSLPNLIKHWILAHNILFEDSRHLRNFYSVKFEEFIKQPAVVFEKISQFMNEEFVCRNDLFELKNSNAKYIDRWKKEIKLYRRYIKSRYQEEVVKYGYTLE